MNMRARRHEPGNFLRIVSSLLVPVYITSLVMPALQAATPAAEPAVPRPAVNRPPLVRTPEGIQANRTLPAHAPSSRLASINTEPTDKEISALRLFSHRLVPTESAGSGSVLARVGRILGGNSAPSTTNDNRALAAQLVALQKSADPRDTAPLQIFLRSNPRSRWAPSLRHELARRLFAQGYFARAVAEWESVWNQVKDGRDAGSLAIGDEVLAHLLESCMGLSDTKRLTDLIGAAEVRPISNLIEAKLGRAKQSVWLLKHKGGQNVMCGPLALYGILRHEGRPFEPIRLDTATDDYIATGLPLTELRAYGDRYQLDLVMARRPAGADIPVPSVMHSAGGHYSTLVQRDGDQYFLVDRAMQFEGWVPLPAIEEQASGYFLVRGNSVPAGWSRVPEAEGRNVFGRDGLHGQEPNGPNSSDCGQGAGGSGGGCGMPRYSFNAKLAAVRIEDTPLGYTPPVGPPVNFRVAYKDLDDSKPATSPNFSNVGRVWAIDWIAWVDHVPGNLTASSRVTVHVQGGGTEISAYKTATGKFGPNDRSFTTVTRTGTYTYTREMPDGSKEVYDTPDNPTTPNRVFLTRKLDPSGNAIINTYDANLRLIAVTDAIGQVTTLEHNLAADPMKITKVTDPFGRTALLGYNAQGQLHSVTDMIGLTSTFIYDATEFITSMTTPYGTTTFTKVQGTPAYNRTVTATDPLGQQERIQFIEPIDLPTTAPAVPASVNVGGVNVPFRAETARLGWRNSFYWSKQAMQQAPGDVRVARNYRWYTDTSYLVTGVLESVKEPLEDPVWFNYPNQAGGTFPYYAGQGALPAKTLRILPDGTPQLSQTYYNALGLITNAIDPVGRSTVIHYSTNQLDALEVRQLTGSTTFDRIAQFTYNDAHQPLTATDAAGQTTRFNYNSRGQLLTIVNVKEETTSLQYDPAGYLTAVDGPLPGETDVVRMTYDGFGRLRTVTDPDGYQVTLDYDAMDRPTVVTYPDGTFEQITYDRLHRTSERDRAGRVSDYTYDALQRLVQVRDALNRVIRYDWCRCGELTSIIDPLNRVTTWRHDVQGRKVAKVYADGSRVAYVYENGTSRLQRMIDEKGQFTEYDYNIDDTLRQVTYPNANVATPSVRFTFDSRYPRLTSMTDGSGLTQYSYHPASGVPGAGRLAAVDGPLPDDTITLDYDEIGRAVRRAVGGVVSSIGFDALGRVGSVSNILGSFSHSYHGATPRPATTLAPNAVLTSYQYFGAQGDHELAELAHTRSGTTVSRFNYSYNAVQNVASWTRQLGAAPATTFAFDHDAENQLTNAVLRQGGSLVRDYEYAYDAAANRFRERVGSSTRTFSFNVLNEVSSSSPGPAVNTTYEWDGAHRLTAINRGSHRSEFAYDGMGRRIRAIEREGGVMTSDRSYVWLGLELGEERDGATGEVIRRYFPQGEQIATGPAAGAYFYSRDHLGSIRELTDATGAVRARYDYDPWGRRSKIEGDVDATFGFTGYYHHQPSGLSLAPFRAYDPELGRWLSRDPLEEADGINLFAYVGNSVARVIDPLGLFGLRDALGFVPVLGSALDAYDAFKCGNIGMGLLNLGLAALDLTGAGALAKGLTVGAFKLGSRALLNQVYRSGRSMAWENVRGRMLTRGLVTRGRPTHHWLIHQNEGLGRFITSDRIINHPFNLMPDISDAAHNLAHHGNLLERAMYGTPGWAKLAGLGAGSYGAGQFVGSGCQ